MNDDVFDLTNLYARAAADTGVALSEAPRELALYTARRAEHLSTITHEPGFLEAVDAERDSIAIRAGIVVDDTATAADRWFLGVIQGALAVMVRVLATG